MEAFHTAMTNRSLRTVKAELEFLAESNIITSQQLNTILSQLPTQPASSTSTATPAVAVAAAVQPPTAQLANTNLNGYGNEKQANGFYGSPSPAPVTANIPPPAYPATPSVPPTLPPLAHATALYAYNPTDAGDLALMPNDRVAVTEYMNAEWWKGRNERTNQEGIFPRSYVRTEEKAPPATGPTNYGNAPLEVSGMGDGEGKTPGKGAEAGKKFGKKLGNAAIFGAGATIGSNIVNSIF